MSDELIRADAVTLVGRLKKGEVTPHDLLDALEKRIAAVDGSVNALPTLFPVTESVHVTARLPVELKS